MKKILFQILILLSLCFLFFLSFSTLMPIVKNSKEKLSTEFSIQNAFKHVEELAKKPHYTGSDKQTKVRNYIVNEFQNLGLEVHTQNGYVINDYNILTNPENIITVLEGTNPKPKSDLLVMAHYDSDPHASLGAADDASAVATILESLRVFLDKGEKPENNIIFLITDAEEIGLLGAKLFVDQHPLIENVGLVLNFEARGTSGPSNAILETNFGNKNLINSLAKANPQFPVTSSLMYEIYKTMPNDTDATVFRKEKNIPSFFFAFIDGHYNYHAATDSPENLSLHSLAHQGSYLSALLPYYGNTDLKNLESAKYKVFFNFPIFKIIHYDYIWIFPLLILAWIFFLGILAYGFRTQAFNRKKLLKGFLALFIALISSVILGIFGWKIILNLYPQYQEIQQGFPYNGHTYIAGFACFSLGILFFIYNYFWKKTGVVSLFIAPLAFWLLINTILAFTFKGASYFIIPLLFFEISIGLMIYRNYINPLFLLIFTIPAIFIFSPLVLFVPVALGMRSLFAGLILLSLLLLMIFPVFKDFKHKNGLGIISIFIGVFFLVKAHLSSEFSADQPKPNSLVFLLDKDQQKATWNTYDNILDDWTKPFFENREKAEKNYKTLGNKYGKSYTYSQDEKYVDIPGVEVKLEKEKTENEEIAYSLKINFLRKIDRISLFSNQIKELKNFSANDILIENLQDQTSKMQKSTPSDLLLTYYVVGEDALEIKFTASEEISPEIEIYGASHDLLNNTWIKVPQRKDEMMPRPFVLNDAIITKQNIKL